MIKESNNNQTVTNYEKQNKESYRDPEEKYTEV